jgi:hypothetical protein
MGSHFFSARDQTMRDLGKFESLRYPDLLLARGVITAISFESGRNPAAKGKKMSNVKSVSNM